MHSKYLTWITGLLFLFSAFFTQAEEIKEGQNNLKTNSSPNRTASEPLMSLTHTTGNFTMGIFNDGSIGANNFNFIGPGLTWKGQNGLFVGGPVFGTLERATVNGLMGVFVAAGILDLLNVESDFASGFISDSNFDQITIARLDDSVAPNPYNVEIIQQSYTNSGDDYGFIRYGYINKSGVELINFYAGVTADWDIGSATTNSGGYAAEENLVYNFDTADAPYYYGIAALNGLVGMMTTTAGAIATARTDAFAQMALWDSNPIAPQGDFRSWVGTGPFDIAANDTAWVTFAFVAGDNLNGIRTNAQHAANRATALGWLQQEFNPVRVDPSHSFSQITTGALVTDREFSSGASWGDYNNDGFMDVFISNFSILNSTSLYQNNGDGSFTKITTPPIGNDVSRPFSSVWGDYNNDGYLDLYVSNGGTSTLQPPFYRNFLYQNEGPPDYNFTQIQTGDIARDSAFTWTSSWVDYDNDGDLDLHSLASRRLAGHPDLFYENDGSGNLSRTAVPFVDPFRTTTSGAGSWIDFDNDGDQDLYIAKSGSDIGGEFNELYKNMLVETGMLDFQRITSGTLLNSLFFDFSASWGDFDNDGDPDLFSGVFGNINSLYRNDYAENAQFARITTGVVANDAANTIGSIWGDFDNDGDLDLFVANGNQFNRMYLNQGQGHFIATSIAKLGAMLFNVSATGGSAAADYDNDGDLDILIPNGTADGSNPDPNFLYRNDGGNGYHWININCRGMQSNAAAIGTKVRLKANIFGNSYWQLRHISGSPTGDRAQNSPRVHFGLGDATIIDSLKIEWPSGIVDIYTNVDIDGFYEVREGVSLGPVVVDIDPPVFNAPQNFALFQNFPNPFNPSTTIEYHLPQRSQVQFTIYNILGEEIRTLLNETQTAGVKSVLWDGKDNLGRAVSSGVYIYQITAGDFTRARKMIFLR